MTKQPRKAVVVTQTAADLEKPTGWINGRPVKAGKSERAEPLNKGWSWRTLQHFTWLDTGQAEVWSTEKFTAAMKKTGAKK